MYYLCLYATRGIDLRGVLRSGADDDAVRKVISDAWTNRTDRGAEDRLAQRDRSAWIPVNTLKRDPHLEMHTRGG
jgi:cyclic pyranopterin phosphate synthase